MKLNQDQISIQARREAVPLPHHLARGRATRFHAIRGGEVRPFGIVGIEGEATRHVLHQGERVGIEAGLRGS